MRTYNIKETYVDKDDPWSGILATTMFVIFSTENRLKVYSTYQLVFGNDMIIPHVRELRHKVINIISAKIIK